jgi:hypothetical protein
MVVLQLGGKSLINKNSAPQLAELKRICDGITAIIDSERASAGDIVETARQDFAQVCRELKIKCHILERRATENYVLDRAVKKVNGDNFKGLGPYERLSDVSPNWGKAENWRIAREMALDELGGTDHGAILGGL